MTLTVFVVMCTAIGTAQASSSASDRPDAQVAGAKRAAPKLDIGLGLGPSYVHGTASGGLSEPALNLSLNIQWRISKSWRVAALISHSIFDYDWTYPTGETGHYDFLTGQYGLGVGYSFNRHLQVSAGPMISIIDKPTDGLEVPAARGVGFFTRVASKFLFTEYGAIAVTAEVNPMFFAEMVDSRPYMFVWNLGLGWEVSI